MAAAAFAVGLFDEDPIVSRRVRLADLSDHYLLQVTRLSRNLFEEVLGMISPQLERQTMRSNSLPTDTQLLISLGFYASGGFQWLSEMCGQVSQPTCSRVVEDVTAALCQLAPTVIRFPMTADEQAEKKIEFHQIAGFPNVLGCIDGTHVTIRRPTGEHPEQYLNCHQRFSVNVMAVCDAGMRFTNVFADYPGSNDDTFIFAQSSLARLFENGTIVDGWLLGDSAYGLQMWMMTPLNHPVTDTEMQYQAAHTKTRCAIERAFGLLKSRFRCLDDSGGILSYSPQKVCRITVACCVLHNLCLNAGIEHEIDPDVARLIAEMAADPQTAPPAGAAAARQRRLIDETAWPALS